MPETTDQGTDAGNLGINWESIIGKKRAAGERRHERHEHHRAQAKALAKVQQALQVAFHPVEHFQLPGWQGIVPGLPAIGRGVYSAFPGQTPPTVPSTQPQPQPQPTTPLGWADRLLQDALLAAQVVADLIERFRGGGGGTGFDFQFPAGAPGVTIVQGSGSFDPRYIQGGAVMPSVSTGSIWGTLGQALGQLGTGVLQQLGGPQAMPGGAPIGGIVPGGYTGGAVMGPTSMLPSRRGPSIVVMNGRAYRSLGTPIAWSGDLAAVKRLRRAAQRIGRVIPHRRSGGFR